MTDGNVTVANIRNFVVNRILANIDCDPRKLTRQQLEFYLDTTRELLKGMVASIDDADNAS